jgi:UDP-N-acetylglucosamine--N-acetylmuramyl-(pentapeptide) pyrophosphoryl-undecaprenol N-acetylglucosamine transferase
MKVLFSGGGTLGSVTPLLAISETLKNNFPEIKFVWVGTKNGSERRLLTESQIPYFFVAESKLRRYFSFLVFQDIFNFFLALLQAFLLLKREKPDLCISAGSYVSVPVHIVAKILGIPTWIHQQDVRVGLANRIMAYFANLVTVTLEKSKKDFGAKKAIWLGNPIRKSIFKGSRETIISEFAFDPKKPIILATGGGTGAERLNELISELAQEMGDEYQWIHLIGETRKNNVSTKSLKNYRAIPFVTSALKDLYAASDLVISRGGFGTLSELAALQKTVIVIPIPGHQEENVSYFEQQSAVISFDQSSDSKKLSLLIQETLKNLDSSPLSSNLHQLLRVATDEDIVKVFHQFQK